VAVPISKPFTPSSPTPVAVPDTPASYVPAIGFGESLAIGDSASENLQRCIGLGPASVEGNGAMFIGTLSRLGLLPGSMISRSPVIASKLSFTGNESFSPERSSPPDLRPSAQICGEGLSRSSA
jgi:hypothetical protein